LQWGFSQANSISFVPEIFDIAHVLEENEVLLKDVAHDKKITIVNETQSGLLVWAHPNSIKTVVRNLISNAIKFTNKNGKVTLRAEPLDGFIKVSVIDTGVGIIDVVKNSLFKVGYNRSSPGTADEKGSGLGLLLCKEFVEKNGGTIDMETSIGNGSTFYFTVPVASDVNAEEPF
jgi:signal transduction histidine kinase